MTEQERAEWEQRLQVAVEQTLRRRAARRQLHQDHADARAAGLVPRNRARLARARTRGEAMPETPDTASDVLTVDVDHLRPADLASIASALARVAGWSTLTPTAALVLGHLAQQAQRLRGRRGQQTRAHRPSTPTPDGPDAA